MAQMQDYLSQMQKKFQKLKLQQKAKQLNQSIINQIDQEIIQNHIEIPTQQKSFKLISKEQKNNQNKSGLTNVQEINNKIKQIQYKKRAMLKQLEQIKMVQNQFQMSKSNVKISYKSQSSSIYDYKLKPQLIQESRIKIKQIKKSKRRFQKKIQEKLKKYQENIQSYKKEQQQQETQKIRSLAMGRHIEREKYIQQIKERNQKRQKLLKQQQQKILQLKKKQKLFEKLQQQYHKKQQQQQQILNEKIKQQRQKHKSILYPENIKHHQQNYEEIKRKNNQKRQEKHKNFILTENNYLQNKPQCLFLNIINQDEEIKKYQEQKKKQMIQAFKEKKKQYAQNVRKILLENKKFNLSIQTQKINKKQEDQQPKWLNTLQKYKKGTNYMRQVHSSLSKLPRKQQEPIIEEEKSKPLSKIYKNYLQQIKNVSSNNKQKRGNSNIQGPKTLSHMIMKTNLLESKQNLTAKDLLKSVKAKLQMVKKIQNNGIFNQQIKQN